MIWIQVTLAAIGLAKEIVQYLRQNCDQTEAKKRIRLAKGRVRSARLNGSQDLRNHLDSLFSNHE